MFDELERLGENEHLFALLAHYARAGAADRETWQGRVMRMDGLRAEDLVKLHGELIAYDWIEQNTGAVPVCYRVTPAGLRAFREAQPEPPMRAAA
ncbi:MAG TPA: hypothetical protein VKA46_41425 [Gemmataceae bacterium]|nr:hypothetical protein [Gemmataceae bacterium]